MREALYRGQPDLVVYIAGADPYADDRYGRLKLSKQGLAARDALVYETCEAHGLPVAVTMGGGYARDVGDIVDIHYRSIVLAAERLARAGAGEALSATGKFT